MNARHLFGSLLLAATLPGLFPSQEAMAVDESTSTANASLSPPYVGRTVTSMDADWRFSKGEFANAMSPAFDDGAWQMVAVPHDWSSDGPFSGDLGSGNGFAPGGIGWYRRHFRLDASQKDKVIAVEFDGVYDHSEVWINGHFVGGRPYGYSSFECVLTPLLHFGTEENILAVRVDHSRFADSRWYTGSGIYRHVRLRTTDTIRIAHWGTFITTPEIGTDAATVRIETTIANDSGQAGTVSLLTEILAPDGRVAGTLDTPGTVANGETTLVQNIPVSRPQLWSPATPVLYTARCRVSTGGAVVDQTSTPFGIRTLRFDPDKGFFLNGSPMKLKGVCIHHDAGCLGAAVPEKVLERRLRLLQELGVNAIRTSHNPPAPELLDLCDRLGLLVKDEAFDEFTPAKNKWLNGWNSGQPSRFGYAESFKQWSVTDARDMVRRDRNHPSVIMWSIGNEIDYANDPFSHPVLGKDYRPWNPPARELVTCAQPLIDAVKKLDPTRPVTAALATVAMSDAVGLGERLDIVGYNYQEPRYAEDHKKYPGRFIFGSENGGQYDNWMAVQTNDYVGGQFLWTGIDYLGEANRWPNRGSSAGLLDLCAFKKPNAWFRQSLWSGKPMVYLCATAGRGGGRGWGPQEHWNWNSNATITVRCFTSCPEAALTLNGRSLGVKKRTDAERGVLTWEVPFEAGELKAVGRANGGDACEFSLKTSGPAHRIELLPDTTELRADGRDICHLEFRIVDEHGVRVTGATPEVTFAVTGPAKLIGIENGDLNSPSNGKGNSRAALHGRGLAFLQAVTVSGPVTVQATSPGLIPASVSLTTRGRP